jgi:hypothetical protein
LAERADAIVKVCSLGFEKRVEGEISAAIAKRLQVGGLTGQGALIERGALLGLMQSLGADENTKRFIVEKTFNCLESHKAILIGSPVTSSAADPLDLVVGQPVESGRLGKIWAPSCRLSGDIFSCTILFEPSADQTIGISAASAAVDQKGNVFSIGKIAIGNQEYRFERGRGHTNFRVFSNTRATVTVEFHNVRGSDKMARLILTSSGTDNPSGRFIDYKF